jgi:hypothetical protein
VAPPQERAADLTLCVFRMTLSSSRPGYEDALPNQNAAAFTRAHEHAFLASGGCLEWCAGQQQDGGDAGLPLRPDLNGLCEASAEH